MKMSFRFYVCDRKWAQRWHWIFTAGEIPWCRCASYFSLFVVDFLLVLPRPQFDQRWRTQTSIIVKANIIFISYALHIYSRWFWHFIMTRLSGRQIDTEYAHFMSALRVCIDARIYICISIHTYKIYRMQQQKRSILVQIYEFYGVCILAEQKRPQPPTCGSGAGRSRTFHSRTQTKHKQYGCVVGCTLYLVHLVSILCDTITHILTHISILPQNTKWIHAHNL